MGKTLAESSMLSLSVFEFELGMFQEHDPTGSETTYENENAHNIRKSPMQNAPHPLKSTSA